MAGILSGVLTSLICILAMAAVFSLSHETYVTLLPKSITVAIGMGVSEELGGYVTITVAVILITGILGNMIGEGVCRLFRIKEPIARGVAIGTASHAIGTARAMEMGEVEGAMSSLSIAVAGLLTVAFASVFSFFGKETAYLRAKDRILTRKYLGGVDHMKEIKLKADKPFHNNVDVAVIDFPDGPEGEERQRCKVTVEFAESDVKQLQDRGGL